MTSTTTSRRSCKFVFSHFSEAINDHLNGQHHLEQKKSSWNIFLHHIFDTKPRFRNTKPRFRVLSCRVSCGFVSLSRGFVWVSWGFRVFVSCRGPKNTKPFSLRSITQPSHLTVRVSSGRRMFLGTRSHGSLVTVGSWLCNFSGIVLRARVYSTVREAEATVNLTRTHSIDP